MWITALKYVVRQLWSINVINPRELTIVKNTAIMTNICFHKTDQIFLDNSFYSGKLHDDHSQYTLKRNFKQRKENSFM